MVLDWPSPLSLTYHHIFHAINAYPMDKTMAGIVLAIASLDLRNHWFDILLHKLRAST